MLLGSHYCHYYDYQARPTPPVMKPSVYELTTLQDDIIPFARTSGARFCSSGQSTVWK